MLKPTFKLEYNKKDITKDVSNYVVNIEYTDFEHGQSDEISITFEGDPDIDVVRISGSGRVKNPEEEANKKDNLWDRFLNLLAGNIPFKQTPQERVMMMRWVNGEKGEL